MRHNKTNSAHNLLIEVAKTVQVFGDEGTADILRNERIKKISTRDIDFIINMVCEKFGFSETEVVAKCRNNKRLHAMQFICYYCNEYLKKISNYEIGIRINRDEKMVRLYHSKMVKIKKGKSKENEYMQSHFKHFDEQIKQHLINNPSSKNNFKN